MNWTKGRQNTGYEKMLLCSSHWPIPFDVYLIRYRVGNEILPHVDSVATGEHHRVNVVLKKATVGGEFVCVDPIYDSKRIKYFRPDVSEHSVTKVIEGSRYILSIGWIRK